MGGEVYNKSNPIYTSLCNPNHMTILEPYKQVYTNLVDIWHVNHPSMSTHMKKNAKVTFMSRTRAPVWCSPHASKCYSKCDLVYTKTTTLGIVEPQLHDNYAKHDIWCPNSNCLPQNRGVVSPTLNVNPPLFVIP